MTVDGAGPCNNITANDNEVIILLDYYYYFIVLSREMIINTIKNKLLSMQIYSITNSRAHPNANTNLLA